MAPPAGVGRRGGRVSRRTPRRPIVRRYDAARRGVVIGLRPICGACRAACTLRERDSMKRKHLSLAIRSEEHTSELQSLMRISYAVFCLKKKNETHAHKFKATYTSMHNDPHNLTTSTR